MPAAKKPDTKPALMMKTCEAMPVTDQERIACGLHIASRGLASALANVAQPHGLSGLEANFLLKLDYGLESPSGVATYLGIDASNLSRLMRRLEKEDLIIREIDDNNRSRVIIRLTSKGKRTARKIKPDLRAMEKKVLSPLSSTDQKSLQRILKKMCASLMEP